MKTRLTNLMVVNPHCEPKLGDILLENDSIIACDDIAESDADRVIDMHGLYAFPGIIDLHAHLRDPGKTDAEDIASGTKAAVCGGITALVAMPNTQPVCDSAERWQAVNDRIRAHAMCEVFQAVAGATGLAGHAKSPFLDIDGVYAVSDDGKSEDDANVLLDIFRDCKQKNVVYLSHAEDDSLRAGGVINAGHKADALHLKPIYNAVEDTRTYRDCLLAQIAGSRVHMCHVSTEESIKIVVRYKKAGVGVTCEVTPHHFTLCDDDIPGNDGMYKMNPPLRSKHDKKALIEAIKLGAVDAIATDHAPHLMDEKTKGFESAPFGIIGFETLVPLSLELYRIHGVCLGSLAAMWSSAPAAILKLSGYGRIQKGHHASLSIIDINKEWALTKESIHSKTYNTPFLGKTMTGKARFTVVNGKIFDCEKEQWV